MATDINFMVPTVEGHSEEDPTTGLLSVFDKSGQKITNIATKDAMGKSVISPDKYAQIKQSFPAKSIPTMSTGEAIAPIAKQIFNRAPSVPSAYEGLQGISTPLLTQDTPNTTGVINTPEQAMNVLAQQPKSKEELDAATKAMLDKGNPKASIPKIPTGNTNKMSSESVSISGMPINTEGLTKGDKLRLDGMNEDTKLKQKLAEDSQKEYETYVREVELQDIDNQNFAILRREKQAEAEKDYQYKMKKLDDMKVEDDGSAFSKIIAALMVGLGEVSRIQTGGTVNIAQQIVDTSINQSIERQKANINKQQNVAGETRNFLGDLRAQFQNDADLDKALTASIQGKISTKLQDLAMKNEGNALGAQAKIKAGELFNSSALLRDQLANGYMERKNKEWQMDEKGKQDKKLQAANVDAKILKTSIADIIKEYTGLDVMIDNKTGTIVNENELKSKISLLTRLGTSVPHTNPHDILTSKFTNLYKLLAAQKGSKRYSKEQDKSFAEMTGGVGFDAQKTINKLINTYNTAAIDQNIKNEVGSTGSTMIDYPEQETGVRNPENP